MFSSFLTEIPFIQTNFTYKGFGWESFYQSWLTKISILAEKSLQHDFTKDISDWCNWVSKNNIASEKEIFEKHLLALNINSLDILTKVIEKFEEQFQILINGSSEYWEFKTVVDFLQDLPYQVLETIEELESKQEVVFETVKISTKCFFNFWKERYSILEKMLVLPPTSFYY
ncbi:hypothetical protein DCCM_3744 [Desulfocucumis palustris]|uniref:Uncharacterized protein n=2 Tax=Desulfocucumis palustris TaxID=1898651 RepID=A0A2L2XF23_9FIRM|nr:hypothetical protein DCCM_3744 [Desulfocucumis palustris]